MNGILDTKYDEDISENEFYKGLIREFPELYTTAASNKWLLCVPCSGSLSGTQALTDLDFQNHVLLPDSLIQGQYNTLHQKKLIINNGQIITKDGFSEERKAKILFEEVFYVEVDDSEASLRILCIDQMLEGGKAVQAGKSLSQIHRLAECDDILWGRSHIGANIKTKRFVDDKIVAFLEKDSRVEWKKLDNIVDAVSHLCTHCYMMVSKNSNVKRLLKRDQSSELRLRLSVEAYVLHQTSGRITSAVTSLFAQEECELNKQTRNLSHTTQSIRALGLPKRLYETIPRARRELLMIDSSTTPRDKLTCVRRAFSALTHAQENGPLTADDYLPAMAAMILRTEIANWYSTLVYMNRFRFAKSFDEDEFSFYLATMEAAINYIKDGMLAKYVHQQEYEEWKSGLTEHGEDSKSDKLTNLFNLIRSGDEESLRAFVQRMTSTPQTAAPDPSVQLCHPLCSCDRCEAVQRGDPCDDITLNSRDDNGYSALHVAAMYDRAEMVDILVLKGADINLCDFVGRTPLHIACWRGNQRVTLMLLHFTPDLNAVDRTHSTPLHLATYNGHEECLKALLFHRVSESVLDVDCKNDRGDTPLIQASRWGYKSMVELLLDAAARQDVYNRQHLTASDVALTQQILNLLRDWRDSLPLEAEIDVQSMNSSGSMHSSINKSPQKTNGLVEPASPAQEANDVCLDFEQTQGVVKLLKTVARGDIELVKHMLGWNDDDEVPDVIQANNSTSDGELCHPLCQCDRCQPKQQITLLSKRGLNVNSAAADGVTSLHVACARGLDRMASLLLAHGAAVNANDMKSGRTPLHEAAAASTIRTVKLLLEQGAKVNSVDRVGNTPLHLSAHVGSSAVSQLLLEFGARISVCNSFGNSPLHEAASVSSPDVVRLLLENGAKVSIVNKRGLQPLQLAKDPMCVRILEKALVNSAVKESILATSVDRNDPMLSSYDVPSISSLTETLSPEERDKRLSVVLDIQRFPADKSLRSTITRDRSAPRLDQLYQTQSSSVSSNIASSQETKFSPKELNAIARKSINEAGRNSSSALRGKSKDSSLSKASATECEDEPELFHLSLSTEEVQFDFTRSRASFRSNDS